MNPTGTNLVSIEKGFGLEAGSARSATGNCPTMPDLDYATHRPRLRGSGSPRQRSATACSCRETGQPSGWPAERTRTVGCGSTEGRSEAEDRRSRLTGRGGPCASRTPGGRPVLLLPASGAATAASTAAAGLGASSSAVVSGGRYRPVRPPLCGGIKWTLPTSPARQDPDANHDRLLSCNLRSASDGLGRRWKAIERSMERYTRIMVGDSSWTPATSGCRHRRQRWTAMSPRAAPRQSPGGQFCDPRP